MIRILAAIVGVAIAVAVIVVLVFGGDEPTLSPEDQPTATPTALLLAPATGSPGSDPAPRA
jgi:hypothetical protein